MLRAVIYELETMPSTSAWVSVKEIDKLKAEIIYWREMAERLMKATMNIANVADLMFDYEKPELF